MEKREYEAFFQLEGNYWWFKGQRDIILDILRNERDHDALSILDAGCGTGKNLETIRSTISPRAVGFDISSDAVPFLKQRQLSGYVSRASVNAIPHANDSFDLVLCLSVFECEEVNEASAYSEIWRVVRPGGRIIILVSAHQWLLATHDKPIHAVRRYNRKSLTRLVCQDPTTINRLTFLYPTLFPIFLFRRLLSRWLQSANHIPETSDLKPLPNWLNSILHRIIQVERHLLRRINFPWGSSILLVGT